MSVSSPGHECSGNSRTLCAIKMLRAARASPAEGRVGLERAWAGPKASIA